MKKEIKVADLDYPINLGETKTPKIPNANHFVVMKI